MLQIRTILGRHLEIIINQMYYWSILIWALSMWTAKRTAIINTESKMESNSKPRRVANNALAHLILSVITQSLRLQCNHTLFAITIFLQFSIIICILFNSFQYHNGQFLRTDSLCNWNYLHFENELYNVHYTTHLDCMMNIMQLKWAV